MTPNSTRMKILCYCLLLMTLLISKPILQISTGRRDAPLKAIRKLFSLNTKDRPFLLQVVPSVGQVVQGEASNCHATAQLFGNGYSVFRCDRSSRNSTKKCFGGVLIAIKQCHPSSFVTTECGIDLEQVCVAATINGKNILFCAVYVPPDKSNCVHIIESHVATIRELCNRATADESVLICGDYNQPRLMWTESETGAKLMNVAALSAAAASLIDGTDSLNLIQLNSIRNHLGRTLDLFFGLSDEQIEIRNAPDILVPVDLHHPPVAFDLPAAVLASNSSPNTSDRRSRPLNFRKTDFSLLLQYLNSIDWDAVFGNASVDVMTETFCNLIGTWLNSHVPKFKRPVTPAWSTPSLRQLRREKNACLRRLRKNRTVDSQQQFKAASTAYRRLNALLYKHHVLRVQSGLRKNPRSFWTFVNSKRKSSSLPTSVFYNDAVADTPDTCCNLFADFRAVFLDTASSETECSDATFHVPADSIDFNTFEIDQRLIENAARKLKSSFAPGPDGIPAVIYSRCIEALSLPLAQIYNRSFQQRKFPDYWKNSFMFPVFKNGERRNVKQYRGITSLSAGSKLFEIVVSQALLRASSHYIAAEQHGFMPGRSRLDRVFEVDDLGVILDAQLTFDSQRTSVIRKANRQLGFISKVAREFRDPLCLKSLYCALVRYVGFCESSVYKSVLLDSLYDIYSGVILKTFPHIPTGASFWD
ncbi:uncharacterized protein LOC129752545 [Uranotaenia lowii]|uniref:uncharacterized protein LOC129752545 n=1 Tax=Uranotaenia lowii TaxID=190385 RepID=UPI00247AC5D0|nr:uncharacterized protein LOC129752545 [Uranotaenia lowii]